MVNALRTLGVLLLLVVLPACDTAAPSPAASPDQPAASGTPAPIPSPEPEPSVLPTEIGVDESEPVASPGVLRVGPQGAALANGPAGGPAGHLRAGVLVPYEAVVNGWAQVTTPCELTRWMPLDAAQRLARPMVVLDPGHGGNEPGAVGGGGLQEKEVNLDVARRASALLNSRGIPTILTLGDDYRATLGFRVALARSSGSEVLVSVHYNAAPDGPMDKPGTETYYQFRSPDSKRLAGLIYEEVLSELSGLDVAWVGDTDAGAKWRLNSRGGDYYGLLRLSGQAGLTAVLAELGFISNPPEEELLRRDDYRQRNAEALVRGVERYLTSDDPGSGFSEPYPREVPAGAGGGARGCVDPQ